MKVAIMGFGTVGSSVARILCDLQPDGIELSHVFNRSVARKIADWTPRSVIWTEDFEVVLHSDVDVIVELVGGLDSPGTWVRRSLEAGKSVVTGNKKLIAKHGVELDRLARSKGAHLLYGAAVAGGIPVIPGLQQGLAGDRITRIEAILNGTCNYILSRMEAGDAFADVLRDAQNLGYAEANPSEDVDGYDARAKLVILSRIALRSDLDVESVACRSITEVDAVDLVYARDLNCTIRQISKAELRDAGVSASVGPMLVPLRSPFAWSRGTENMVLVSGQYGGDVVFSGHGAGGNPTAVAVVSDLISLAHGSKAAELPSRATQVSGEFELRHYIRFVVQDRPGIVAEIAGALASEKINIDALFQRPGYEKGNLPFVVTVEPCSASALRRALDRVGHAGWLAQPPLDMPILGE
jgi:homoserine dehydrogenase